MTTTFNTAEQTWFDFLGAFNRELITKIDTQLPIIHKLHGAGYITYIKAADNDVYLTIDFPEASKQYSLRFLIEHPQQITVNETVSEILSEIYEAYEQAFQIKVALDRAEIEAKRKDAAQQKELAKKEAAEKARRERAIARISTTQPQSILPEPATYYEAIGWMAKNIKSIKATVPSDLEPWFAKNFGTAEHTVIDSNKKTLNGNPMKWSISFKVTFKNELPAILTDKASSSKRVIDSVSYVWDLVENRGFSFGNVQNLDKIRSYVPSQHLTDFERGLA